MSLIKTRHLGSEISLSLAISQTGMLTTEVLSKSIRKKSQDTRSAISSPESVGGHMQLDLLGIQTTNHSGPDHVPVSRSRSQAKAKVSTTFGICGPTSFASSVPRGPLSSWENRLRERLAMVGSTESALIWRGKVTPAGASISRLSQWTPPISEAASTGSPWATPAARDYRHPNSLPLSDRGGGTKGEQLPNQMAHLVPALWPTPNSCDGCKGPVNAQPDVRPEGTYLPHAMAATARMEAFGPITSGSSATTAKRGAPNPEFPCWLQGFPPEYLNGAESETPSTQSSQRK